MESRKREFEIIQNYICDYEFKPQINKQIGDAETEERVATAKRIQAESLRDLIPVANEFCCHIYDLISGMNFGGSVNSVLDDYDGCDPSHIVYECSRSQIERLSPDQKLSEKITGPYAPLFESWGTNQDMTMYIQKQFKVIQCALKQQYNKVGSVHFYLSIRRIQSTKYPYCTERAYVELSLKP